MRLHRFTSFILILAILTILTGCAEDSYFGIRDNIAPENRARLDQEVADMNKISADSSDCAGLDDKTPTIPSIYLIGLKLTKRTQCLTAVAVGTDSTSKCREIKSKSGKEHCETAVNGFRINNVGKLSRLMYHKKGLATMHGDWKICLDIGKESYATNLNVYDCIGIVAKELKDQSICDNILSVNGAGNADDEASKWKGYCIARM